MIFRARTKSAAKPSARVVRPPVNRRKKRAPHVLAVNIRSDRARIQRNHRIITLACQVVLVLAVLGGLYWGGLEVLNRVFFKNPVYAITHIDVQINGTLTREQVVAAAGVVSGANIFSVKLPAARQALLDIPQVGDAEVQRVLPDTVKITVQERRPIAWLVPARADMENLDHRQHCLLDASGVVLKSRSLLPEYLRLPVICGYPVDGLRAGKVIDSSEVMAAISLLGKVSEKLAGRYDIQSVDLARGYCLDVTDREKTSVRFAFDDLDFQVQRLGLLLDYCDANNQKMETVNLMVRRNVPVTFVRVETTGLNDGGKTVPPAAEEADTLKPVRKALPVNPVKKGRSNRGKG